MGAFFKPKNLAMPKNESVVSVMGRNLAIERSKKRRRHFENLDSSCVYGEFPLSFAASMGQVRMMTIMKKAVVATLTPKEGSDAAYSDTAYSRFIAQYPTKVRVKPEDMSQADHVCCLLVNAQDNDGNTALHMSILHNQVASVDWILANGGSPSLRLMNLQGFTPLTLAAKMGLVDMFHHLIRSQHMSEVSWRYGSMAYTMLNLEQIDTFVVAERSEKTGSDHKNEKEYNLLRPDLNTADPDFRCAIRIIVDEEKLEFAKDDFFCEIIMEKWDKFARAMYLQRKMMPHYFLTICFIIMALFRAYEIRTRWEQAYIDGMLDFCPQVGLF